MPSAARCIKSSTSQRKSIRSSRILQEPIITEEQWLRRSFADIAADLLRQAYLSQLRQKAAFLYGKRPETQSEILEMLEVVDLKLSFAPYGR